jgi:L-asparaginase II
MAAAPDMVAGPGRFTSRLIAATGGRVIGKEGAEGVYCAAVRGPTALGVALKIADGSLRARDGVVLEVLRLMGALSEAELAALADRYRPEVTNHRGQVVGHLEPAVELEEAVGGVD